MQYLKLIVFVGVMIGATIVLALAPASFTQANSGLLSAQLTSAAYPGAYVGRDFRNVDPTLYPAVGGQYPFAWSDLQPQEGVFRWDLIDHWLDAEALQSGKRAAIAIATYHGRIEGGIATPSWVYTPAQGGDAHAVVNCSGALIPRYWDAHYLATYNAFVQALGERYNNDPRLTWLQIGTGLYGETQPAEDRDDSV